MENAKLFAALIKAQAEIGFASKSSSNPHFQSKYADLAEVTETIKPVLAKHGLGYIQKTQSSPTGASIETIIIHESGESYSAGTLDIPAGKANAHAFGSALTYARRYGLAAAFGVATADDDGNAATGSVEYEQRQRPQQRQEQPKVEQPRQEAARFSARYDKYRERIVSGGISDVAAARTMIQADELISATEKALLLALPEIQLKKSEQLNDHPAFL
ncbi:MAG: ERF family protein [Pseudomonadota bacterium]